MIAAIILTILATVVMGVIVVVDVCKRSEVNVARRADRSGRRAQNLLQAVGVMPRGYLPKGGLVQLLGEVSRCADVMIKTKQKAFVCQGIELQRALEEKLKELKTAGITGPSPGSITSKSQVEVVKEGAKYLHEYVTQQAQKDQGYYEGSEYLLLMLEFSCTRAVSDYYANLAQERLKTGDEYNAQLALDRAAETLKPWIDQSKTAKKIYKDRAGRAKLLKGSKPQSTVSEKQWKNWEAGGDWKKKAQYD